ncbi:MAG: 5'-methylthioadenosine/S-adenosylhomocysteine nucleosidase, partial [Clostridia bacterium]|nr:5'-methylthioadenosine/S-adenosylhomocysteine nucleosidase [Clostridia bacterium]
EKKKKIVENFGAIVCEMEGASIAQVCYTNGVPFGVVRAVSDCADGSSHMDYGEFLPMAAANAAKLIELFVEKQ